MNASAENTWREARYAVLRHAAPALPAEPAAHFDFLLETQAGADLKTWRLATWPASEEDCRRAEPLPDHRNLYLSYEGPISRDRGSVTRVEGGICRFAVSEAQSAILVRLPDERWLQLRWTKI